jgi:hypothetical protein
MDVTTETSNDRAMPNVVMDDAVEAADYRKVSGLAIFSLLLGIAAPLSFFATLLWAIPLVGVAVALLALRQISESNGTLVGRTSAIVGLALSVVFVSAASTREIRIQQLHTQYATAAGMHWIELLRAGQIEQAYDLTYTGARPSPPLRGETEEPKSKLVETFAKFPAVNALSNLADTAVVRADKTIAFEAAARGEYNIQKQFILEPSGDQPAATLELVLRYALPAGSSERQWLLMSYELEGPPASNGHDHSHGH